MQVCTLLQTDNHASTPPLSFLQAGCPSCRPTNSVKALKANAFTLYVKVESESEVQHGEGLGEQVHGSADRRAQRRVEERLGGDPLCTAGGCQDLLQVRAVETAE